MIPPTIGFPERWTAWWCAKSALICISLISASMQVRMRDASEPQIAPQPVAEQHALSERWVAVSVNQKDNDVEILASCVEAVNYALSHFTARTCELSGTTVSWIKRDFHRFAHLFV